MMKIFLLVLGVQSLKLQRTDCDVTWDGHCLTDTDYTSTLYHTPYWGQTLPNYQQWGNTHYSSGAEAYGVPAPPFLATRGVNKLDGPNLVETQVELKQRTKAYLLKCADHWNPIDVTGWTLLAERKSVFQAHGCSEANLYEKEFEAGSHMFNDGTAFYIFVPAAAAKAGGDPHVQNVKGEKFNINRIGDAPLVSIRSDGAPHLEVMALIQGANKKCQKKMFITRVNSSGSWLEKNVEVKVREHQDDSKAFSVMVDGQEVWSPASRGYEPPTTEHIIFHHADKFSINEMSAFAKQPGIEVKMAHDIKMKIVRPMVRPTAPPHLNFDIQGLTNLPSSFKLGGLLGHDDHSYWSTREEDCHYFAKQTQEVTEGSHASAH